MGRGRDVWRGGWGGVGGGGGGSWKVSGSSATVLLTIEG